MTFKIDEDFKKCLPELTAEEYTELEKDVVKNGVLSPIVLWNETIVDGHNRYAICQAHRIENIPTTEMKFNSKDEALEWILRNQLGRRNLNDFQRNMVALKYEEVIAKRMKERQGEYYGNRYKKVDSRPKGQKSKTSPTTRRHELAKIAGTSEGSIERTKLIVNKGTPEQIARAKKGGRGNSITAIADEVAATDAVAQGKETRKCRKCGRVLPLTEFSLTTSGVCKGCRSKKTKDTKARLRKMTEEEVIGNLYDTDRVIEYTDDDLKEELVAKIEDFKWSVQNCLKIHADLLKDKRSREKVLSNLSLLQNEITKWKELYDYE